MSGDKVIIQRCEKISTLKSYYVKSIVKPFGRHEYAGIVERPEKSEHYTPHHQLKALEEERKEEEKRKK